MLRRLVSVFFREASIPRQMVVVFVWSLDVLDLWLMILSYFFADQRFRCEAEGERIAVVAT